jgi:PAS domain S-box-containing protein
MEMKVASEFTGAERPQDFLIVGIGASAGGIQALKEFFEHVPEDSGMAYVVILHLSPDHDSKLAEVLRVVSRIPVLKVIENMKIRPDHVYVVPPDKHLIIQEEDIAPSQNLHMEDRRAPVDIFFRHLADTHGPRAVCVVLSGTGANGSMGLKRVKEKGGAAYVQNPREAEFNEMPRNSIATELVDEVLPVAEIPQRIIAYRNNQGAVQIAVEPEQRPETQQQALREVFTQLRIRTGHDFSNYKRPTLLRRIERRINVRNLPDLPSYTSFINEHPDETTALLKDLLISVTNFFRDQKAFDALERDVLPNIFRGKKADDKQVRIWVAGCATGEEAYSIAMLCAEQIMGAIDAPKVQIFATDIDETAIATAREGIYTLSDVADVSNERLRRFFFNEGDGYRVRREIREMVLFAHHNFLTDPPFSRLDLISCRNVLIYLNNTAQERVIETFHFALKPKTFLFLGTSESVEGASDLFAAFDRDNHIFRTREVPRRNIPVPDVASTFRFGKTDLLPKTEEKESRNQRISFGELHQKLLEQYAPPSVVITEDYEIVHMSETVGRYFQVVGGEPTQNLLKLIRPEIRLELRAALYQAIEHRLPAECRNLKVVVNGVAESVDIHIRPVLEEGAGKGFILVIIKSAEKVPEEAAPVLLASDEPVARQLEQELIRIKSQLRSSIEQHELQSEELKASNEELQAMNEELRSALEELETSKEELQSINEELRTVNQELKVKVEETTVVSNNLQNLITSADFGTIFLDRLFCIRLFSPAVLTVFNLKPSDQGRPISDITHRLQYDRLIEDAETVLQKLTVVEREVATHDNRSFLMRVLPYRTSEDRINGVVITFFDITRRKESEEALRQSRERLQKVLSIETVGVIYFDLNGKIHEANAAFETMSGFSKEQLANGALKWDQLQPTNFDEAIMKSKQEFLDNWQNTPYEKQCIRPDGSRWWGLFAGKRLSEHECVEFVVDITEQKRAEEKLKQFAVELEKQVSERTLELNKSTEALQKNLTILHQAERLARVGSWEYHFDTKAFTWSAGMYDLFGLSTEKPIEPEIYIDMAVREDEYAAKQLVKNIREGSLPLPDTICINVGDKVRELKIEATIIKDEHGNPARMVGVDMDVTLTKQAQKTLAEQAHFIRSTNEAIPDILFVMNLETKELVYINHSFEEKMGYKPTQIKNFKQPFFDIVYEEDKPALLAYLEEMKGLSDGVVQETEYRLKAADGTLHWFRDRNTAFRRNREGRMVEKIGIAQDITEARKAEQALKESNLSLRYANENLQRFASIASHDLQEPLRKLKLFASILRRFQEQLPEEAKEIILKIHLTSERMSQLIREVLQFSKIAYAPREFVPTDLDTILQNVLSDLELLFQETGTRIQYYNKLPEIDAIPLQIYQLFYNLLTNAVKFRKKDVKPVIGIAFEPLSHDQVRANNNLEPHRNYVDIVFSDNGIGFDTQYAEQIFQIFERLHSVQEYEGTGVGLALCKKIMENHSGEIYAISAEGAGAAFHILLPVKQ